MNSAQTTRAVRGELQRLVQTGAYASALSLGQGLLIQCPMNNPASENEMCELQVGILDLIGQALVGLGDYHRAINYFSQAEQLLTRKAHPDALRRGVVRASPGAYTPTSTPSSGTRGSGNSSAATIAAWLETEEAGKVFEICFSICKAYLKLRNERQALVAVERIPDKKRTPQVHLCIAQLYQHLGSTRAATQSYKFAWTANPFALEAAHGLVELGVSVEEIFDMTEGALASVAPWLRHMVEAYSYEWNHRPKRGLEALEKLGPAFDGNSACLVAKGRLLAMSKNVEEAAELFSRAHALDDTSFDGMDIFASVLYQQKDSVKLNRLTQKMLQMDDTRAEGWTAAAYYSLCKQNFDKALMYVEQAIESEPTNYNAHCTKGEILMLRSKEQQHAHMDAINAFKKAWQVRRGIRACRGLVVAYLKDGNVSQARGLSREARTGMPESVDAWIILGKVYAHLGRKGNSRKENFEKAKRAYKKALSIDPRNVEATYETSDVLISEGLLLLAVETLKASLFFCNDHVGHTKLAEVYILNKQYDEAVEACQMALSMSQHDPTALHTLERAERGLRGLDPDGDDEGDEGEGEGNGDDSF